MSLDIGFLGFIYTWVGVYVQVTSTVTFSFLSFLSFLLSLFSPFFSTSSNSQLSTLAAAQAEDEVEGALLLDVVVGEGAFILKVLSGKDQALLVRRDALPVQDLCLDVLHAVRARARPPS